MTDERTTNEVDADKEFDDTEGQPKPLPKLRRGQRRAVGRSIGPEGGKVPIRAGKDARGRFRAVTVLTVGGDEVNIYTNREKLPQNLRRRILGTVFINPITEEEDVGQKILRSFSFRLGDKPEPYLPAIGMELR